MTDYGGGEADCRVVAGVASPFLKDMCNHRSLPAVWGLLTSTGAYIDANTMLSDSCLLAVGLVYYLRLSARQRRRLDEAVFAVVRQSITEKLAAEVDAYMAHVPAAATVGVTRNRALKENVFAMVVCIQTSIPLIVLGPPGSTKTLSFRIVRECIRARV